MDTIIYHPEKSVILTDKIGKACKIHAPVWIGKHVLIGDNVRVQAFAFIPEGVILEQDVFIGPHVCFTNDKHPPSDAWLPTIVRRGASIGAGAIILPGLEIGEKAMVGAGSVVTHDVPPWTTVVGNPARVVSKGAPFSA